MGWNDVIYLNDIRQNKRKLCYEEKNSATTGRDRHEKFQLWWSYVLGSPPSPNLGNAQ